MTHVLADRNLCCPPNQQSYFSEKIAHLPDLLSGPMTPRVMVGAEAPFHAPG